MEITSPPATIDEPVIDLKITFAGGMRDFTLRPQKGDTWTEHAEKIVVAIKSLPVPETGTFYKPLGAVEVRERIIKTPVKDPAATTPAP